MVSFWTMEFSQSWQQLNLLNKLKMFFIPCGQHEILFPRRGGNDGICRLERFFGVTLEESGSLGRYFLGDGDFAEAVEEIRNLFPLLGGNIFILVQFLP